MELYPMSTINRDRGSLRGGVNDEFGSFSGFGGVLFDDLGNFNEPLMTIRKCGWRETIAE